MKDAADDAIGFHATQLLDEHLEIAGIVFSSSEKRRTFPPNK